MQSFLELLKRCAESHTFDTGDPENRTVLDQLFCAYQDSHETIHRKSRTASKNWILTYGGFRWMTTMPSGTYVATFVPLMNTKPSLTVSTTACS